MTKNSSMLGSLALRGFKPFPPNPADTVNFSVGS